MNRKILFAAAAAALVLATGPAHATGTTYGKGAFQQGPTSDYWNPSQDDVAKATGNPRSLSDTLTSDASNNQVFSDPATGDVAIVRHNPTPGALDCTGNGPFAYLRVSAVGPASKVTVDYENLAADGYTWVEAYARDLAGNYLGPAAEKRGPAAEQVGSISIDLVQPVAAGQSFNVDFGLIAASACPNVDGGRVTFTEVTVE